LDLQHAFSFMYIDLLSNYLCVEKVPSKIPECSKDGGCILQVISKNPEWYQDFCHYYPRITQYKGRVYYRKNARTIIKRKNVLSVLKILSEGRVSKSKYVEHLKEYAIQIQKDLDLSDFDVEYFSNYGELPKPFEDQF
jgi:hypothetical protein